MLETEIQEPDKWPALEHGSGPQQMDIHIQRSICDFWQEHATTPGRELKVFLV
jgi:hypothetical protein